jgi:hypothetical protein
MFFKVIACEVTFREICMAAARSVNLVDLEFLTQGYHDNPDIGRARLQEKIDSLPQGRYDAVLLVYALCNNMLVGLRARDIPVVFPRAHDCITFFMGSKERYARYFRQHPGTYYYTSGWLEYQHRGGERVPHTQVSGLGPSPMGSFEELVAKYGEDNARFLSEFMGSWIQNYKQGTYIRFDFTDHLGLREQVKEICAKHGWNYDEIEGDMSLLQRLLDGCWDEEDFLVVRPGEEVVATYDDRIVASRPVA